MRSLRVLLLAHNVEDSGTYQRFRGFARHLAKMGHQVTLVAASARRQFGLTARQAEGVRFVVAPTWFHPRLSNGGLAPEDVLARLAFLLESPFDIVHASEHRPAAALPSALLRTLRGATLVSDWADLWGCGGIMDERSPVIQKWLAALETTVESRFHASADAVTVICQDLYDRASRLGVAADRLLNIPNGVDLDECRPLVDRASARQALGLPVSGKLVLYAGEAPFDMELLWGLYRELQRTHQHACLVVVGRRWELAVDLQNASTIIQMGKLPWAQYYQAAACADVLLLPYRNTSRNRARWPGKLSIYMGSGRPIVANPTGDVPVLFEKHSVGLLAEETPVGFARAVARLLDDPDLADELGRNGRRTAEAFYSWPRVVERLSGFYEKVASG